MALTAADATIEANMLTDIVANDQSDLDMVKRAQAAGGASQADVAAIEAQIASDAAEDAPEEPAPACAADAAVVMPCGPSASCCGPFVCQEGNCCVPLGSACSSATECCGPGQCGGLPDASWTCHGHPM